MGDWPGEAAINDSPPFHGVVDFGSDRCELRVSDARMVMDGGATYQQLEDGRWTRDNGGPGQWSGFHPRWPLEAIRRAARDVLRRRGREGDRFLIRIDRDRVTEFTYAGIAPAWDITAQALVDSAGRITRIDIALRSEDDEGQYAMDTRFELTDFGAPVEILLPPPEQVISQREHLAKQGFSVDDLNG